VKYENISPKSNKIYAKKIPRDKLILELLLSFFNFAFNADEKLWLVV